MSALGKIVDLGKGLFKGPKKGGSKKGGKKDSPDEKKPDDSTKKGEEGKKDDSSAVVDADGSSSSNTGDTPEMEAQGSEVEGSSQDGGSKEAKSGGGAVVATPGSSKGSSKGSKGSNTIVGMPGRGGNGHGGSGGMGGMGPMMAMRMMQSMGQGKNAGGGPSKNPLAEVASAGGGGMLGLGKSEDKGFALDSAKNFMMGRMMAKSSGGGQMRSEKSSIGNLAENAIDGITPDIPGT